MNHLQLQCNAIQHFAMPVSHQLVGLEIVLPHTLTLLINLVLKAEKEYCVVIAVKDML